MSTTKKLSLWLLSVLVVAGIGAAVYLSTPAPAAAARCIPGPCPSYPADRTTPTVWGTGNSCAAARSSAEFQAHQLAGSACGRMVLVCDFTLVEHGNGCWFNASKGMYQVDAHATYSCANCETW